MSPRTERGLFSPEDMTSLRQARLYAVPRWMIEQATERRLAGDWRGALAVARFDVAFDLANVAAEYGAAVARSLEFDLRSLVPDLVRWHLPRVLGGRSTLGTDRTVVLAGYGSAGAGAGLPFAPYLFVRTPRMADGPQRLVLRFGAVRREVSPGVFGTGAEDWRAARCLWHAAHTDALRARAGGTGRIPFFRADGSPRPTDGSALPESGDPVARAERTTLLHQGGKVPEAFAAAGIERDPRPPVTRSWYTADPEVVLAPARRTASGGRRPEVHGRERHGAGPDRHGPGDPGPAGAHGSQHRWAVADQARRA